MPKQRRYRSNVDESLYWFPRLRGEDENNTIFAPTGQKTSARRKLKSGNSVCVVVECHLELVPGNSHERMWFERTSVPHVRRHAQYPLPARITRCIDANFESKRDHSHLYT